MKIQNQILTNALIFATKLSHIVLNIDYSISLHPFANNGFGLFVDIAVVDCNCLKNAGH